MSGGSWVRLIPLGGLGEIGMNMTCLETAEDCLVLDAGLMFPPLPSLARERLRELGLDAAADLRRISPDDRIDLGSIRLEFIRVCHSIPDGIAVAARTPAGLVLHTGDFKFDPTPVDGVPTDEARFAAPSPPSSAPWGRPSARSSPGRAAASSWPVSPVTSTGSSRCWMPRRRWASRWR